MKSNATLDELFGKCPYATVQSLISGKWAVLILYHLESGPLRFNELLKRMPKMTNATLASQLKSLEEKEVVQRTCYESVPPKVEYSLTEIGSKVGPVIEAMVEWGNEYIDYLNQK